MSDNLNQSLVLNIHNNLKIHVPNSTRYLTTYVLIEQEKWFESEIGFCEKYLKPGMNVIDIGANFGLYTLNAARALENSGKIIAFEPTPDTANCLHRSVEENNFNNIAIYQLALSNRKGESTFYINENSELNSLNVETNGAQQLTVKVDTLDNISHEFEGYSIDFVKLDAEGEEANILSGARRFLLQNDPLLMFEYKHGATVNESLLDALNELDFVLLRHIPGLNILAPVDKTISLDEFQLNLFSCSVNKLNQLVKNGFALGNLQDQVAIPDDASDLFQKVFSSFFCAPILGHMQKSLQSLSNETDGIYIDALKYYCIAVNSNLSTNERMSLLMHAYNIVQNIIENPVRIEYLLTFSRISLDLGFRAIAVNTLSLLLENFDQFTKATQIIPFLPVYDKDFKEHSDQPLFNQIYMQSLVAIEKLQSFSSYFQKGKNFPNLERLMKLGCEDSEILRRYELVKIKNNLTGKYQNFKKLVQETDENLNPQIWKVIFEKSKSQKARADDFQGRFLEILADPSNAHIPRVENAGTVVDNNLVMHNGLMVSLGEHSYYGDFADILKLNKGVHEPQEERVFMEVLKYIKPGATMIELGAYWSFYSMWFQKEVSDAINYMVEPEARNIDAGKRNFVLNNMQGDFTLGCIGDDGIKVDEFVKQKDIDIIDLLHSDIQGFEYQMLQGAKKTIEKRKIKFIFVSTHSQDLHYACLQFLKDHDYIIIASADFDHETFCYDGIIVAKLNGINGPDPVELEVRNPQSILSLYA